MKLPNTPDPKPTSNQGDYYFNPTLWHKKPSSSNESTRLLIHALDGNIDLQNIDGDIVGDGLEVVADGPFSKKKIIFKYSRGFPRFIDKNTEGLNVAVGSDEKFCIVDEGNIVYDVAGGGTTITQTFEFKPGNKTFSLNGADTYIVFDADTSPVTYSKNGITQEGMGLNTSALEIIAGDNSGTVSTDGNDIELVAGKAATGQTGGDIVLTGGDVATSGNGGSIHLLAALGPSGNDGQIHFGKVGDTDYFAAMNAETATATYQQTHDFTSALLEIPTGANSAKPTITNGLIYAPADKNVLYLGVPDS